MVTSLEAAPLGYVGANGSTGTIHFLRHDVGDDEVERFFETIRPLVGRPEITLIRVSGHAGCSGSGTVARLLRETGDEARRSGVAFDVLPGLCPSGRA